MISRIDCDGGFIGTLYVLDGFKGARVKSRDLSLTSHESNWRSTRRLLHCILLKLGDTKQIELATREPLIELSGVVAASPSFHF
jgi:hypothetical protein